MGIQDSGGFMKKYNREILTGCIVFFLTTGAVFLFLNNTMSYEKAAEKFVTKEVFETIQTDITDMKGDIKDIRNFFLGRSDGSK